MLILDLSALLLTVTKPSLAQQGEPLNPARQGPDGRNLNSSQGQTQEVRHYQATALASFFPLTCRHLLVFELVVDPCRQLAYELEAMSWLLTCVVLFVVEHCILLHTEY
jgi:hypothetical protein